MTHTPAGGFAPLDLWRSAYFLAEVAKLNPEGWREFMAENPEAASRLRAAAATLPSVSPTDEGTDALAEALVDSLDGEPRARADGLTDERLDEIAKDGSRAAFNDPWAVKQERIELAKEVIFLRQAYRTTAAALDATCEREEAELARLATPQPTTEPMVSPVTVTNANGRRAVLVDADGRQMVVDEGDQLTFNIAPHPQPTTASADVDTRTRELVASVLLLGNLRYGSIAHIKALARTAEAAQELSDRLEGKVTQ